MTRAFYACLLSLLLVSGQATAAAPIETKAKQAVVADVETGAVLFSLNAYEPMFPASMTKMMTAHILFDYLKNGKLKMTDTFIVSENAWRMQGSKMFVHVGDAVPIEDLMRGIIIQSGNDACIVVAEGIAGSEEAFAAMMNAEAEKIGMKNSHFKNSTGMPDEEHIMSPYDLYLLARDTIRRYPDFYKYYAEKEFTYNEIKQPNRNLLLDRDIGVDGLKTGHTEASGFGITISGVNKEDGRRLVVVVNGLTSDKERADEAERLLIYGYRNFENRKVFAAGQEVAQGEVWFGQNPTVPLVAKQDVLLTLPKAGAKANIKLTVKYNGPIASPVVKGTEVGTITVLAEGQEAQTVPLLAGADVGALKGAGRIVPAIRHYLFSSDTP